MCGGQCFSNCSKEDCNHVSGCPNDKMTTLQPLQKEPSTICYIVENIIANNIISLFIFFLFLIKLLMIFNFLNSSSLALPSTYETSWRVTTSKRTALPSSKHTLLITEVPNTQMGLIRVNILAGGSLLIVFLLCAIVRELYTCKSKKSKKKT